MQGVGLDDLLGPFQLYDSMIPAPLLHFELVHVAPMSKPVLRVQPLFKMPLPKKHSLEHVINQDMSELPSKPFRLAKSTLCQVV